MLASFMNSDPTHVEHLFQEVASAQPLDAFKQSPGRAKVHPGRREAWYAIARLAAPRTVVETGVADGLGTLVLLSALARNALEGRQGRYVGIDIVEGAGSWAREWMGPQDQFVVGQSISAPAFLAPPIDLLILDSDHDPEYEASELEVLGPLLSPHGIVISDNCHVSDALRDYSVRHGRAFMIWHEEPLNHWYPGASLGLSLPVDWRSDRVPTGS